MNRIRLLLTSDLHIGITGSAAIPGKEERIQTFRKICSLAEKHDILLIAGDLINDESTTGNIFEIIREEFARIASAGVEIYYTAGKGELISDGSINPSISGLPVTRIFSDENAGFRVKSGKGDLYIYGTGYGSASGFTAAAKSTGKGLHIGLFNAGFNPVIDTDEEMTYIGKDDIKKMNLDFYAMGSDHNFRVFKLANRIIGAYAGSPEPCSPSETGDRFVISIEAESGAISNIKRIAVNTTRILCNDIDCTGLLGESELVDRIKTSLQKENSYIIRLTGKRDFIISDMLHTELTGCFRGLEVVDDTLPHLNILLEEHGSGNDLQSEFFRTLNSRLDGSSSGVSRQMAAKILCRNASGRRLFCDF
ncbi:MAG TPA: hypothetical protein PK514_12030 [Spirochaetota bacterium]|nr:hypothetical protein [Spirochaetota bacterium]